VSKRRQQAVTGKAIRQKRSRKTYEALIQTGFELLEERGLDSITIADLVRNAGYSVGAFYARFASKDEFFDALLEHHLQHRRTAREHLLETLSDEDLIPGLVGDLVEYYWKRRWFWRAALIRSIRDPERLRGHADELVTAVVARINARRAESLTTNEERNLRSAFRIMLGSINNAVIYETGTVFVEQQQFIENLVRTFGLVSDYDRLVG
jgi:AcrR family transcriptional regulator